MPRSGPKPFVCTVCGKSFSRKPDLNRHTQIHNDDAVRFYCAYPGCHHSSLQKSNLKTHYIARHLRQRLHKCRFDGCTKSYSDGSTLIRHEKSNHNYFRKAHKATFEQALAMIVGDALIKLESPQDDGVERLCAPSLCYSSGTAPSPSPSDFTRTLHVSSFEPSPVSYTQPFHMKPSSTDAFLHEMLPELFPDPKLSMDFAQKDFFGYPSGQSLLFNAACDLQAAYFPSFMPFNGNFVPDPLTASSNFP